MATSRYLEVIKRFLRAEMYFRARAQTNPNDPNRPVAQDKP